MFQITALSLLAFITFSCSAMQNQYLQSWVQAVHSIQVKSPSKLINSDLPINANTTAADIKTALHDIEGLPAHQQSLHPIYKRGILRLSEETGPELGNRSNIKQIMHLYNTRTFLVVLHLNEPVKG